MASRGWVPYGVLFVGVAALSWSAILIREADAPALILGSYRMVLAGAPVGALALYQQRRSPERVSSRAVWPLLVLSAVFLAAHFAFWFTSVKQTSVVTAVVLVAVQPLYVAVASPLLLRERIEPRVWLAVAIAGAGALVMVAEDVGDGLDTLAGDGYAVLGGMLAAGYIMMGRRVRPSLSWSRYVGTVYPMTAVLLVAAALIAGDAFTGYTTKTYIMIVLLALGPQLIGHNAINWSLAFLPAVIIAIAILGEPVGAAAWSAIVLDEPPTRFELLGAPLVLIGIYVGLRSGGERVEPAPEPAGASAEP